MKNMSHTGCHRKIADDLGKVGKAAGFRGSIRLNMKRYYYYEIDVCPTSNLLGRILLHLVLCGTDRLEGDAFFIQTL